MIPGQKLRCKLLPAQSQIGSVQTLFLLPVAGFSVVLISINIFTVIQTILTGYFLAKQKQKTNQPTNQPQTRQLWIDQIDYPYLSLSSPVLTVPYGSVWGA